jgi:hypothetical protein
LSINSKIFSLIFSTLFIRDKKFQTKLLSTLTEEQKDQFWKKWAVVLLAD